MHKNVFLAFALLLFALPARADFLITSAVLEFTTGGPRQQDIELVSRSAESDYIVSEISEIVSPGTAQETRRLIDDPTGSRLLVTPDKTVLTGKSRRVMRFVLLQDPDAQEHIYRVAIKPVVKGVANSARLGLKVLIGYEVLVIIRPQQMRVDYHAERQGNTMIVRNDGNSNILLNNGEQCAGKGNCKMPPVIRAYPGQTVQTRLPLKAPVRYAIWDGQDTKEQMFD